MKKRIWELDAFRGFCILAMVIVHLLFDLIYIYQVVALSAPAQAIYGFLTEWGGVLFLLLSGICVTLGAHPVRRGLIVFGSGMLCTLVTWLMYRLGFAGRGLIIWFGVLHCLGVCMLLWPLMKRLPVWMLAVLGLLLIVAGLWIKPMVVEFPWLMPLGLVYRGFVSSDYFPLLPNLGFFLVGAVLGKTLYRKKQTLFSKVNETNGIVVFLSGCGRWSLLIYLLHQPLITGILELIF